MFHTVKTAIFRWVGVRTEIIVNISSPFLRNAFFLVSLPGDTVQKADWPFTTVQIFLVELSKWFHFTFFPDKLSSVCNLFCVTEFALLHVHCFNSTCLLLVHCPVILNVCWLLSLQILSFAQNWSLFWTVWSNILTCSALRRLADFQLTNFWNPSSLIVSNTTELMVFLSRKLSICYRWSMVKIHWLQEQ